MTVIQRTPWRDYAIRALILGGFFGVVGVIVATARGLPIGAALLGAGAFAVVILVFAMVVAPLAYPTLSVDFTARTVRMRFRYVPIASLTQAWRRVADVRGGGVLLFYRLRSTEGPRIRVIVAGRGFPVLDTPQRQALLDLIAAAPLEKPDRPATRHSSTWVPVGAAQMRSELLRLDLDLTAAYSEEELRAEAAELGLDPEDPMRDERLR